LKSANKKGVITMAKYKIYEYDVYKDVDGVYTVNEQYEVGTAMIDIDDITTKELKQGLKRLFGLKRNIRLSSLYVDGDDDVITLDYAANGETIPIGHLERDYE